MRRALLFGLCLPLFACEDLGIPSPDLERMIDQARYEAMESSEFFADGRAMRTPPEGTVPRSRVIGKPMLTEGVDEGVYAAEIQVEVTEELLARGRARFDIYCAVCHGPLGDGESRVAQRMKLRKPPSLFDEKRKTLLPGRIFEVITHGYGLMPSYAGELPAKDTAPEHTTDLRSINDRWAVVAYVKALQLSQGVSLEALPTAVREEAEKSLR